MELVKAPVAAPSRALLYTARKGDTLVTIADRFGVSLSQLRRWNKTTGIKVAPGSRLHVAETASASHGPRGQRRGGAATSARTHEGAKTKGSGSKASAQKSEKAKKGNAAPAARKANKHAGSAHAASAKAKQK